MCVHDGESIESNWKSLVGDVAKRERSTRSSCMAMIIILGFYQEHMTRRKSMRIYVNSLRKLELEEKDAAAM